MFRPLNPEGRRRDPNPSIIRNSLSYIVTGWWNRAEDPRGSEARIFDGDQCVAAIKKVRAQAGQSDSSLLIQIFTAEEPTQDYSFLYVPQTDHVERVNQPYANTPADDFAATELAQSLRYLTDGVLNTDGMGGMIVRYESE